MSIFEFKKSFYSRSGGSAWSNEGGSDIVVSDDPKPGYDIALEVRPTGSQLSWQFRCTATAAFEVDWRRRQRRDVLQRLQQERQPHLRRPRAVPGRDRQRAEVHKHRLPEIGGSSSNNKYASLVENVYKLVNLSCTYNSFFRSCENMDMDASVLPANLPKVGDHAFEWCKKLSLPYFPASVTLLESGCCVGCTSLKMTSLPPDITAIPFQAFIHSYDWPLASLPMGITSIGAESFWNCYEITISKLPDALVTIGNRAFYNCRKLQVTEIPAGVTTIDYYAFNGCWTSGSDHSITFKGTPTSIGSSVFGNNSKLKHIYMPWSEGAVSGAPWRSQQRDTALRLQFIGSSTNEIRALHIRDGSQLS